MDLIVTPEVRRRYNALCEAAGLPTFTPQELSMPVPLVLVAGGRRLEATTCRVGTDALISVDLFDVAIEEHAITMPRTTPADARIAAFLGTTLLTAQELRDAGSWVRHLADLRHLEQVTLNDDLESAT